MITKEKQYVPRKGFLLFIIPILFIVILTAIQCNSTINCTNQFETISLKLEYPDGQPVLLDSSTVFWERKNRFLIRDSASWYWSRKYGYYTIIDDTMQKELEKKRELMHFTGFLNGKIVCERYLLVGADECHVSYYGKESLTQVIQIP